MNIDPLYDLFTGRCIRKIAFQSAPPNAIYLTFDDGPTTHCTPPVLDLLARYNVKATFFLIGEKAQELKAMTDRILNEGHTIGNHSIDHDTRHYYEGFRGIDGWIQSSIDLFETKLNIKTIGFRSPLGIKTPALNKSLRKKKLPLILWNVRFYDTKYGLNQAAIDKKIKDITDGSIILLHDCHEKEKQKEFLASLEYLIVECQKKKLIFYPLEENLVMKSYLEKYRSF